MDNEKYIQIAKKIAQLVKEIEDIDILMQKEYNHKQIKDGLLLLKISIEESIMSLIVGKATHSGESIAEPDYHYDTSIPYVWVDKNEEVCGKDDEEEINVIQGYKQ